MTLSERYVVAKIKGADRTTLMQLQQDCGKEIQTIKDEKSDVFRRFPGVHGRFQQSQLDVLDIREQKACAMFDHISEMIFITKE